MTIEHLDAEFLIAADDLAASASRLVREIASVLDGQGGHPDGALAELQERVLQYKDGRKRHAARLAMLREAHDAANPRKRPRGVTLPADLIGVRTDRRIPSQWIEHTAKRKLELWPLPEEDRERLANGQPLSWTS